MDAITFASNEQAKEFGLRVLYRLYQMSHPMGMGWFHYDTDVSFDRFKSKQQWYKNQFGEQIYLDYCDGRMVKSGVIVLGTSVGFSLGTQSPAYQSWAASTTIEAVIEHVLDEMTK